MAGREVIMYNIVTPDDARTYILNTYSIDLHDYMLPEMREVDQAKFFAAVTCVELAKRSLQAIEHGNYWAARLSDQAMSWRADPSYLENKAVTLRVMAEESRVCSEVLKLAIMAFMPKGI
jgi:hypothetical protein